ncbi:MAG TPA: HK97 gp10 family phage protein [Tissierellia bacterium]|nr:HK97 gp10 family phage protein [Tissierellia bacterium]
MVKRVGKSPDEHYQETHGKLVKSLEEGMKMVEADAKLRVGVDTGTLRRSITSKVEDKGDKIQGEAGSYGVEYAFFHALQNDYLESSLDDNLEAIRRKIGDALK